MLSPGRFRSAALLFAAALLGACDGNSTEPPPPPPPTYSISGTVAGAGAGVSVRVVGTDSQTVVTDAGGAFAATGLRPGAYTVTPTQPGFVFDPIETSVTLTSSSVTGQAFTRIHPDEGLPVADVLRIDAAPESSLPEDSVILPNGQTLSAYLLARGLPHVNAGTRGISGLQAVTAPTGPQQRKNDIVSLMLASARDYACARRPVPCTKWNFAADPADPSHRPAQTGLTYIWGGKRPDVRTRGSDGCKFETFGMDCSGLVSRIAEAAGLAAPAGSANQSDPAQWIVPAAWKLTMKRVTDGSIETGDILGWDGHIGIAERSGTTVNVISSTGIPGECSKNVNPPRGPRSLSIAG
jgi:cell wall-associated NlpC family hydrolase